MHGTLRVKLQKYTIISLEGDINNWMHFWNQFNVEYDQRSQSQRRT